MGNCSAKNNDATQGRVNFPSDKMDAKMKITKSGSAAPRDRFKSVIQHNNTNYAPQSSVKGSTANTFFDQRLANIYSEAVDVKGDYAPKVYKKSKDEEKTIRSAIKNGDSLLFTDLEEPVIDILISAMEPYSASFGSCIIQQGEIGDYFYVLEKGSVGYYVDEAHVGTAKSGDTFGDLALLYDCPRAATVIAEDKQGPCELWRLDQTTYKKVIASSRMRQDDEVTKVLKKVKLLQDLDNVYLSTIADALGTETYSPGQTIFKRGEDGTCFYIIKEGVVKLSNIGLGLRTYVDQELTVGGSFGERSLLTGDVRAADAIAKTKCVLLSLTETKFREMLGPLEDLIELNTKRNLLRGVPVLAQAGITSEELTRLVKDHCKDLSFPRDTDIEQQGEAVSKCQLYMIKSGQMKLATDSKIVILASGDFFGDSTLFSKKPISPYTVTALGNPDDGSNTVVHAISRESFISVLGGVNRVQSKHSFLPFAEMMKAEKIVSNLDTSSRDPKLTMDRLKKMKLIGTGTFGSVWLTKDTESNKPFALKIQPKFSLIQMKQVDGVLREKEMMMTLSHPFLIHMVNSFQDTDNLYMVLKLYPGGELFSILHQKRANGVMEHVAKFYAAGILEALDFMHLRSVVYRDLKPENIMVDAQGYCILIDMGFAKVVIDKTYTLCGTPLYIAPEVVLGRGHNKAADIWSYAVLLYEMIYGTTPFYEDGIDQIGLFHKIVRGQFRFPPSFGKKQDVMDLIKRMLNRTAVLRLGCLAGGADDIRNHKWFEGYDFQALLKKEITAPWVPKVKDPFDTRNFEDWSHLENANKRTRPLSREQQAKFKDF